MMMDVCLSLVQGGMKFITLPFHFLPPKVVKKWYRVSVLPVNGHKSILQIMQLLDS